jgi:hypothetical protein
MNTEIIPNRQWIEFFRPLLEADPIQLKSIESTAHFMLERAHQEKSPILNIVLASTADRMLADVETEVASRN